MPITNTVSTSALIQRINRKLAKDGEKLITSRSQAAIEDPEVGRYYVIDTNRNIVMRNHVNLEAFAREIGVLSIAEKHEGS